MPLRRVWITGLLLTLTASSAQGKTRYQPPTALSPEQSELVQKAIAAEKVTIKQIRKHSPLVQTYIQNMRPDQVLYAVPESDQYLLGRVDFGKSITDTSYSSEGSSHGLFKGSMKYVSGLTKAFKMQYISAGFMEMMFLDPISFDQQHYDFSYVRRDFLGAVRTLVFDVHPRPGTGSGRFTGRIWVEDQDGNIVRFNGTYSGGNQDDDSSSYFHFDSWRENLQPGLWLPVGVYVEETQKSSEHPVSFKAQTYIWGYSLKLPTHESDNESVKIDDVQDQSDASQDLSPLEAQRQWISQAEENLLDRLVQAGLLAPPSDFDKILEQVSNNIVIGNNIPITDPIHCRVLLTAPLESLAVGNTIILSKGLIDVLPTEADLAAVLSFQLAHIVLGHHIDTRYAFDDRLLFPDEATFERIHMSHSDADNGLAAKKAIDLLSHSVYANQLSQAGLFFSQLDARSKQLIALNTPRLGDSLLRPTGEAWLNALVPKAPELDMNKLDQVAALPLGSNLKIDAWDDSVIRLNARVTPVMNARDKMPFEVTPVFFRLDHYHQKTTEVASNESKEMDVNGYKASEGKSSDSGPGTEKSRGFKKQIVHILFATDRARGTDADGIQEFTGDRAPNDDLVFGSADVSIPPGHTMGVIESPSFFFRATFDKNKDVFVVNVRPLRESDFFSSVDQQIDGDPKRRALVFVHGYDVTFSDAARRLAQITYDLGFPGASILYSWPSRGSSISYAADEGNVEWSSPHFLKFLEVLEQDRKINTIYIIAHSMGNRLVTSAFEAISHSQQQPDAKFGAVIMAAPDLDVGVFSHFATSMRRLVPHITIYESSNDLALLFSHKYHGYSRLGDTDPTMHVFEDYECIEATAVDTTLFGHTYIADSPSILADVFDLIMNQTPASQRFRLQERSIDGLPYWAFRK